MPNPDPDPKPNHNLSVTLTIKPHFESQKCFQILGYQEFGPHKGYWSPKVYQTSNFCSPESVSTRTCVCVCVICTLYKMYWVTLPWELML